MGFLSSPHPKTLTKGLLINENKHKTQRRAEEPALWLVTYPSEIIPKKEKVVRPKMHNRILF